MRGNYKTCEGAGLPPCAEVFTLFDIIPRKGTKTGVCDTQKPAFCTFFAVFRLKGTEKCEIVYLLSEELDIM